MVSPISINITRHCDVAMVGEESIIVDVNNKMLERVGIHNGEFNIFYITIVNVCDHCLTYH